jgi:predicted house-cleaning noncanonical NTP pyrophosphatase (MazG superfamily)
MTELTNLEEFMYRDNPIKQKSFIITRWLERFIFMSPANNILYFNKKRMHNKVYDDTQNIHNSNIQKSFRTSLSNLIADTNINKLNDCMTFIIESKYLSDKVKQELLNYCEDKTTHSVYLISFSELLNYVMNRIMLNDDETKDELMKILNEEMKETICKCFTGRMTRLLNVLNGYYDDINITISSNEQISNIIISLKNKYKGNELLDKVTEELKEREYTVDVIKEWTSFVKDL